MNDLLPLLLAWLAGIVLGALFYGGLWWTVQKSVSSQRPALWFLGSMLLRMAMALAGFYLVGGNHWQRLLLCLLGFVVGHMVVVWLTRQTPPISGASHAP